MRLLQSSVLTDVQIHADCLIIAVADWNSLQMLKSAQRAVFCTQYIELPARPSSALLHITAIELYSDCLTLVLQTGMTCRH